MKIDAERLADEFIRLCQIDSPSRGEGRLAAYLKTMFIDLGGTILEDDSNGQTGSDSGNLVVRFAGRNPELAPIFFNCHMDTVEPAIGVRVRRHNDTFTSQGDTVLGGDDKSGIAPLIEAMRTIRDYDLVHGPVEFVFTTCEEIGLLGAKAFDPIRLRARMGYALDSTGIGKVIIGAPAANRIAVEIDGIAAHAGLNPEAGINAIQLASKAIADMQLGRLDPQSTANIGLIEGGVATNIIPARACISGEVRSHDPALLAAHTATMKQHFSRLIDAWPADTSLATSAGRPSCRFVVQQEYPVMRLKQGDEVIQRVAAAARALSMKLDFVVAGGGSDANIFNSYGIQTAILATGMDKVHSVDERIDLGDMVRTTKLVLALLGNSD